MDDILHKFRRDKEGVYVFFELVFYEGKRNIFADDSEYFDRIVGRLSLQKVAEREWCPDLFFLK